MPARDGAPAPGAREYSVASLPQDGRLEFVIRLMRSPDGQPGLASGWLTQTLALGDEAADVLGMLLIYCARAGVDLDEAMRRKWLRWLEPSKGDAA